MQALLNAAAAAGVAALLISRFCDPASRLHVLDRPNDRSLHEKPTPRSGGLGIMLGVAAGWALAGAPLATVVVSAFALSIISFVDDLRHLPIAARFGAHFVAAVIVVVSSGLASVWWLPAVVAVAWMTNLYNFMDGSDGLAGGMTLFGFSTFAAAATFSGAGDIAFLSLCLAVTAAAFLAFNFHPARIFMGDVGSIPIGFLAGVLGLAGWDRSIWPLWFPLLVFSPFISDASITLARRALRGERVWQAHRDHYYQRMVRLGYGHAGTAWCWYAVMAAVGGSSLLALFAPQHMQYLTILAWVSFYSFAAWLVDHRWQKYSKERVNP